MTTDSMTTVDDAKLFLGEAWLDPIEAGIRDRIRGFIEELIEEELAAALGRGRYERVRPCRGAGEAGSADGPPAAEAADVSPVTGTVIASDGLPAASGRWRSPCRGRASAPPAAGPPSGRAGRCRATPG